MAVNQSAISSRLFLCGDVMMGRGIDQAMANSVEPQLLESHVRDARANKPLADSYERR
jgi:poly-gamma-glutamate synthesis protein (capsule biosynthesis protein)